MKWVVFTMWALAAIVGMFGSGSLVGSFVGIGLLFGGVLICDIDEKRAKWAEKRELRRTMRHLKKFERVK